MGELNVKPLVIYHGDCYDGLTAAWIAREANILENVATDFHAARYGDPAPDVRGRNVDIIDFSYSREIMLRIAAEANYLTVLDHHKTAEDALRGLDKQVLVETGKEIIVKFDMDRSGCGMAWDHYLGGPRSRLIDLIEDRDLWRFKYGDETKTAHAYVASLPMTFDAWDELMKLPALEVCRMGKGIERYIQNYCEKASKEARRTIWRMYDEEIPVVIVNVPYQNASEMATVLLDKDPGARFSAGWFMRADGHVQFSLRSRGDFDVSEVAKMFGGGGHEAAAGFDVGSLNDAMGWLINAD